MTLAWCRWQLGASSHTCALLGLTCSNTLHVIPHKVLLPKQRLSHSQEMGGKPGWQQGMGRERPRGPAAATQPLGTERWHLEQSHTRGTLHPDGDEHHQANSYNGSRMTQCPTLRVSPKLSTYCWQQPKREKKIYLETGTEPRGAMLQAVPSSAPPCCSSTGQVTHCLQHNPGLVSQLRLKSRLPAAWCVCLAPWSHEKHQVFSGSTRPSQLHPLPFVLGVVPKDRSLATRVPPLPKQDPGVFSSTSHLLLLHRRFLPQILI